ncbi:hypothetical protein CIB48_g10981 [Xylaria polymorpha]|nr:hypothetical protein CIB48_g10981 [Xylaria polymorpha]
MLTDLVDPVVPAGVKHAENAKCMKGGHHRRLVRRVAALGGAAAARHLHLPRHHVGGVGGGLRPVARRQRQQRAGPAPRAPRHEPGGARHLLVVAGRVRAAAAGQGHGRRDPAPEGTYGAHKLLTEVFVNDMHRRGFVDAFILRFPSVVVRPGRPTNAASSFLSGMIREPMNGEECVIPLRDRGFRSFLCSPSSLRENLFRVLHMDTGKMPRHIRHINVPGVSVSIQELMDALAKHGGEDKLKLLREETIPDLERILRSWSPDFDITTPLRLGLTKDESGEDIVKEYIDSLKK